MFNIPSVQEPFFVGVDGGGAKCRVVLTDSNMNVLGRSNGGPANPYQNRTQAEQTVHLSIGDAFKNAGLSPIQQRKAVIGMGLGDTDTKNLLQMVQQWGLRCQQFYVTTNLQIANIAAHESENGAVLVVGTHSAGFTAAGGKHLTLGGHGFPLGDKGSGAWLGFSAVQTVLLALDGMKPETQLTPLLENHLKISGLELATRFKSARPKDYAALAPLVFEAADNADLMANAIVEEGGIYLSTIAEKLCDAGATRIALIGFLAQKMLPYFTPKIQAKFSPALHPPEIGAVIFARQQYLAHQPEKQRLNNCL